MTENKVVLITGARKGIGRALAEHYAGRGCHVIGCSHLRQFCRGRVEEFQIPMRIKLVENVMHGERFKKNRREYVAR